MKHHLHEILLKDEDFIEEDVVKVRVAFKLVELNQNLLWKVIESQICVRVKYNIINHNKQFCNPFL